MDAKRLISICLALAALALAGCKKAEPVDVLQQQSAYPAPTAGAALQPQEGESVLPPAEYGNKARVEVKATAAYVFDGAEGPTLYGTAEFENTGDCPVLITLASFAFGVEGMQLAHDFMPVLAEFDAVLPGQTSFVTLWLPLEGTGLGEVAPGTAATLSASLSCEKTLLGRNQLLVSSIYLADNYPGFTTLSGSLKNNSREDCSLNLVHVGFYDISGNLLGAWYFTRNAQLDAGDSKDFVVHMQALPIPNLASRTASAKATGFGFN